MVQSDSDYMRHITRSHLHVGPGGWVVGLWVVGGWVRELTIVVLVVEGALGSLGDSDEVIKVESVGEVLVEVVLEVLNEVHMLLDEVVSSHSWEGEGGVIELPGVDGHLWVLALLLKLSIDLHGLLVVLIIEVSREVIKLNIKLLLRNINSWLATGGGLELDEGLGDWWGEVTDWVVVGSGQTNKGKYSNSVFHFYLSIILQ